jgi:hypothetical protein
LWFPVKECFGAEQTPQGGIDEVSNRTSIATLLVLSASILIGCNINTGTKSAAVQFCVSSESKVAQLQKELKLANERADLEKQKREFAEVQLKKLKEEKEKTDDSDEVNDPSHEEVEGS